MQGGFSIKKHFRVYFRCHIDMTFKTKAWLSQILTPHLFQSLKFNQCIFQGFLYVSSSYLWLSFPDVEFFLTLSVLQMSIYSFLDNKRHSFWILPQYHFRKATCVWDIYSYRVVITLQFHIVFNISMDVKLLCSLKVFTYFCKIWFQLAAVLLCLLFLLSFPPSPLFLPFSKSCSFWMKNNLTLFLLFLPPPNNFCHSKIFSPQSSLEETWFHLENSFFFLLSFCY